MSERPTTFLIHNLSFFDGGEHGSYHIDTDPNLVDAEVREALHRPYIWMDQGGTSKVYTDTEEQYVIKIPNTAEEMLARYSKWGVTFGPDKSHEGQLKEMQARVRKNYRSSLRAYEHFGVDTAIMHINTAPHELDETNIDGDEIAIGKLPFILQRKAVTVGERLEKSDSEDERARIIGQVTDHIVSLWRSDWVDGSTFFHCNMGYLNPRRSDERFIQVDTGDFVHPDRPTGDKVGIIKTYIAKSTMWLENNHPQYAAEFQQTLTAAKEDIFGE